MSASATVVVARSRARTAITVALAVALVFFAMLLIGMAVPGTASATTIYGTVTDEWGEPLAGIDVTLSSWEPDYPEFASEDTVATDASGAYSFEVDTHEVWWYWYGLSALDPTAVYGRASIQLGQIPDWLPSTEWSPGLHGPRNHLRQSDRRRFIGANRRCPRRALPAGGGRDEGVDRRRHLRRRRPLRGGGS